MQIKAILALALASSVSASNGFNPSQIVSYLVTILPESERTSMTADPTGWASSLSSELAHTNPPAFYSDLPKSVQNMMPVATATPTPSKTSDGGDSPKNTSGGDNQSTDTPDAAPMATPFGYAAAGLAAVAGVMAL